MPLDALALAQALIRFPSITPKDAGAQGYLKKTLKPLGLTCHSVPFGKVKNLFARIGKNGPHFCFCGHTDVVPPGNEKLWTHPPFSATVEKGVLYGRGASDMKGNIAAFIAALSAYLDDHGPPKGSISLLITGDEEGESINGTVKVLEWMKKKKHLADVYLVGEPTNPDALGDEIKIGRRGSLNGTLTVTGVQGHAAYPERADNPLPRMLRLLQALQDPVFDEGSKHFVPTNLEIVSIDVGNTADNVIPGQGQARFNVRFNDHWTAATLEKSIRAILDRCSVGYELTCKSNAESFITKPGPFTDLMVRAVKEIIGHPPMLTTTGGTSDARFAASYGPVVEFGLINRTIHKTDEHVKIEDLKQLTLIYKRMLELYFT